MRNVGIDIVKNERFKEIINDPRKYARLLSKKEIEVFCEIENLQRKMEYLASRFAAKEALFKAINKTGIHFDFNKVSILNDSDHSPFIEFEDKNDLNLLLSISHSEESSIAIVILN